MTSARPDLILFVSRRGWKSADPLIHAGWKPEVVFCRGGLLRRVASILALWLALRQRPKAALLTDTAAWIGLVTWFSALLTKRRYVLRLRGDAVREFEQQKKHWHLRFFLRHMAPDAAGIISVSHFVASELRKQAPHLSGQNIRVIPTPQSLCEDSPSFGHRDKTLLIVTSFRLAQKISGLSAFLPAIDQFLDHNQEAMVVVAGNGPLLKRFKQSVAGLKNQKRIFFSGFVRHINRLYQTGLALLHVSDLDAYPSVVNEARACGMPVVVSDTVGLSEQVTNGVDGIILDGRPDALIRAWDLLSNEERWTALSLAGRERVRRLNAPLEIGRQLTEAINDMLGKDPQPYTRV
jgi:glycosyltransferase involved in cell wall biosynthesis